MIIVINVNIFGTDLANDTNGNNVFLHQTRRREGSMVKVKRLLILLNVGMAFLCLTALAILKERVTSSSHSRELVEYHVPLREDLVALRPQVSSTRPISLRRIGNPATLPQPSERDSASLSQPQDSAMFSEFEPQDPVKSPQFESTSSQLKPRDSATLSERDSAKEWQRQYQRRWVERGERHFYFFFINLCASMIGHGYTLVMTVLCLGWSAVNQYLSPNIGQLTSICWC